MFIRKLYSPHTLSSPAALPTPPPPSPVCGKSLRGLEPKATSLRSAVWKAVLPAKWVKINKMY